MRCLPHVDHLLYIFPNDLHSKLYRTATCAVPAVWFVLAAFMFYLNSKLHMASIIANRLSLPAKHLMAEYVKPNETYAISEELEPEKVELMESQLHEAELKVQEMRRKLEITESKLNRLNESCDAWKCSCLEISNKYGGGPHADGVLQHPSGSSTMVCHETCPPQCESFET